jgi:integrase/recombinase XerD
MNIDDLLLQVESYIRLRRALGHVIASEEKELKNFIYFFREQGGSGPIRAQIAVDWACIPSPKRGPGGQLRRLKIVRGFLSHLRAAIPETEVPSSGLLLRPPRPTPYIYSQQEIERLIGAASLLEPQGSLRPHTFATIIGLIASTGLRAGEALRLTVQSVHLDIEPAYLEILQTKFRKSRLVPLHSTTAEKLRLYALERNRLGYDGRTDAFFVSEQGSFLSYSSLLRAFSQLKQVARISDDNQRGHPCIQALRHTFAVGRLLEWYRSGLNVRDLLPHLSIYMGHVKPAHTYWYLTATPELLAVAGECFQKFVGQGGEQ